ncbi:hypothetical protein QUF94_23170 [Peribacillus sp. NJ4]|uniref:hypothetical protein n=1 Tax=Peribacillus sp. NJ4 TaxID=3055862 RepID=UPI0025A021F1|nr:hypothetical protein [Peribacillus sp. NJ4]MDM5214286.1 hypothetical protein [Peribacillus sp. NJ4]
MKKHFLAILVTILMFSTIAPTFSFAVGNKTTVNIEEYVNMTNEYSTNTADSMFNNSYEFATEEPSSGEVGIQPAGFKGWAIQIGIDEAEGVTQSTIKSRLNTYLKNAGVPSKYSLQIADGFCSGNHLVYNVIIIFCIKFK